MVRVADARQLPRSYSLQSVRKALDVCIVLGQSPGGLSLAEISRETGLGKSALYRVLATLAERGFVVRHASTGRYRLGLGLVHVASQALRDMDVRQVARPHLERLSRQTGETVHLVVLSQRQALFVDKVEGERPMRTGSYVGWLAPAYCTASGKVLLAHQDAAWIEAYLAEVPLVRYTAQTITDAAALRGEVEAIRSRGMAVDNEEIEEGLSCLAAPVWGRSGRVVAAVSISGPAARLQRNFERYAALLRDVAQAVAGEARALVPLD